jgi:hypothetical protein
VKKTHHESLVPVSWLAAKHAWFVLQGQAYSVFECSSSIFKRAVLERLPYWRTDGTYGPILRQPTLEMHEKWYLLVSMHEAERPLKLYSSREEAEQAVVR